LYRHRYHRCTATVVPLPTDRPAAATTSEARSHNEAATNPTTIFRHVVNFPASFPDWLPQLPKRDRTTRPATTTPKIFNQGFLLKMFSTLSAFF
jgi:hypothetical protein